MVVLILRSALLSGLLKRLVLGRGEDSSFAAPGSGVLGAAERKHAAVSASYVCLVSPMLLIRANPRDWHRCGSSRKQLRTSPEREGTGPALHSRRTGLGFANDSVRAGWSPSHRRRL